MGEKQFMPPTPEEAEKMQKKGERMMTKEQSKQSKERAKDYAFPEPVWPELFSKERDVMDSLGVNMGHSFRPIIRKELSNEKVAYLFSDLVAVSSDHPKAGGRNFGDPLETRRAHYFWILLIDKMKKQGTFIKDDSGKRILYETREDASKAMNGLI